LKENLASAAPVEAIREPLEAAQQGLAEVSEEIKEAKSHLLFSDRIRNAR
jgi:hypothetical protein